MNIFLPFNFVFFSFVDNFVIMFLFLLFLFLVSFHNVSAEQVFMGILIVVTVVSYNLGCICMMGRKLSTR